MKPRGRIALPSILITTVLAALGVATTNGLFTSPPESRAAARSVLTQKAAFGLDEEAGARRVLGGTAEEFTARPAGGAELGVAGKNGTALHLNGTTAYAATAGPVADTTKSFSVSAWVKLGDKTKNYTFLSQSGNHASGFQLYYSQTYDKWVFNRHTKDADDTQIVRAMSKDAARTDAWTHLAGSYDAAKKTVSLFVNGKLQESTEFTTPWRAAGGLQFGRVLYKSAWQENAQGLVDDVRVIQSPLTAADAASVSAGDTPAHLQELAAFPLDEKSGSASVSGGKGAGPVATLAGEGAELGVAGKNGTALHLNGTTAYAATAAPVLDTTASFSVSAWVKLDDKTKNYTFLSQSGNHASGFQLYYSKAFDKWVFNRHAKDADDTQIVRSTSTDAAQAGVWTQLTGVYDAAAKQIQLFVDGKPQPAAEFTTPWRAAGALQIGRLFYRSAWQEHFAGTIDDIRISGQDSAAHCSRTETVGHRGAPKLAPENTLASLEAAADHGAEWVETDVQFTKDGQAVIMHDPTVDRTTDGTGRVDQLTADQISRLTVKGGGRVPTLEQVLASLRQRSARLLLEIKGPESPAHVEKTLELVTEAGMAERTMIQSFDEDVVRNAAASAHGMKVALLRDKLDPDPVATARKFSLTAYSIAYKGLAARPTALDQLKAAGIDVFVWTVDREPDWQTATTWGVDGIITNRPDVLLQWRKSHCTEPSPTR
ncbi:glycerophosphodiester phosphodiesterase family protein [Streptomyces chrestomyceticus]|uniref:glycerophosphodiester phosphodiesterase family protein n=1 Tax=Streptomyces chrestomyceticus TaxID=68185 RepID=UPI00369343B9